MIDYLADDQGEGGFLTREEMSITIRAARQAERLEAKFGVGCQQAKDLLAKCEAKLQRRLSRRLGLPF